VWDLCHRELFREIVVWGERERLRHNHEMTLAWQMANLTRAKKLPDLRRLLIAAPNEKAQSFTEQRTMLETLSARYGGKVRKVTLHG
jgi:hypothetical protein